MAWDTGQGVQGAMGGAMAGTAIAPGIGTAIGAGLGLLGGFGGNPNAEKEAHAAKLLEYQEMLKQLSAGYGRRTAPKVGPGAYGQNSGFRQNQAGLIAQLEAMGRGEGPSAARMQMQDAMDRAAGAQSSAAAGAGGRGVNAGAAMRGAMNNTAAIQAQGARDTGLMRVNEQMGALNQLGGVIGQGRAADENMSQFNAGVDNQTRMANLQSLLQTMGLNQSGELGALMAAMGISQQGAMQPNKPGLGDQLLAGGAAATPGLMQMFGNKPGAASSQPNVPDPWGNTLGGGSAMGTGSFNPGPTNGMDPNAFNTWLMSQLGG